MASGQSRIARLAEGVHESRIREDFMGGVRSGVNGTPTFFINSMRHDGAWDVETLSDAVLAVAHIHA